MRVGTITTAHHVAAWLQAIVSDSGLGLQPRLYIGPVCDDSTT